MTTIGKTIEIKGEVTGAEDLIIKGRIEGVVQVRDHRVVVASEGIVVGDVYAANAQIEGRFSGNVFATEGAKVGVSASVEGSILSPRVTLTDGGVFNGSIDTTEPANRGHR